MLGDKKLKAFVPTVKPEKARFFYRDILGLNLMSEDDYALQFDANGIELRVTTVPELTPHGFTVLGWNVPDIKSVVKFLNAKGIVFEKYNFLDQDDLCIWTTPGGSKVAWFKDPDGNILSLTE